MDEVQKPGSIGPVLLNTLKFSGLHKEQLEHLVNIVSGFYDGGLQKLKVFPRGIPSVTDGLELHASVAIDQLPNAIAMISKEQAVSWFIYFPYGIPYVTDARLEIILGSRAAET